MNTDNDNDKPENDSDFAAIFGGNVIHSVSRADLLRDGVLIDCCKLSQEAGFKVHVAMTSTVWQDSVAWSDEDTERTGQPQDELGRLWDVLWMLRAAIAAKGHEVADELAFRYYRINRHTGNSELVTKRAKCGPADDGSPCITILEIDED